LGSLQLKSSKILPKLAPNIHLASSEIDSKYKQYIIKQLEKNVVDNVDMNFIFSTGLDLKDTLIDPNKAELVLNSGIHDYFSSVNYIHRSP
jgi:hypothetical protein